jgi:hypothetical protein
MNTAEVISEYQKTYFSLYHRSPTELRDLGDEWVLVNGARMTSNELQLLTQQLKEELDEMRTAKRSVVKRLLKWFSTPTANSF